MEKTHATSKNPRDQFLYEDDEGLQYVRVAMLPPHIKTAIVEAGWMDRSPIDGWNAPVPGEWDQFLLQHPDPALEPKQLNP